MPCTLAHAARDEDEMEDEPPPVHRLVPAAGQPMPRTSGFVSVFDMATMSLHGGPLNFGGFRRPQKQAARRCFQDVPHLQIERSAQGVKVRRMHHTETDEWRQQETARRARQRPPKPPKQAFRLKSAA
jgi:hypothetical protein